MGGLNIHQRKENKRDQYLHEGIWKSNIQATVLNFIVV